MRKHVVIAAVFAMSLGGLAFAQEETIEEEASAEEAAKVAEVVGKIGCVPEEVEKESEDLFELDDAKCEIGQYDIKLDAEYNIISMTRDQ